MLPTRARPLLLLDGMGAVITALGMAFVLVPLEHFFGLPPKTAYALAALGSLFACYSLSSAATDKAPHGARLRGIAVANVTYCALSVLLMVLHRESLRLFGYLYLSIEVLIVVGLAAYELKVARQ